MKIGSRKFQQKRMDTDEGHISYYVGLSGKPILVMIPGSYGDAASLGDVIANIDPKLSLIVVETRGHGMSWPPPANGSIQQFASDVLEICSKEDLHSFYVTGPSIGGMISLEIGRRSPDLVKGIIPIEGWTSSEVLRNAFDGLKVNTLSKEQLLERKRMRKRQTKRWSELQVREFAKIWTRWDGYGFLCQTDIPILEIWGDRGRPKPPLEKLRVPRKSNIEVRWVHNAGHSLCFEKPAQIAALIMKFIERVESELD